MSLKMKNISFMIGMVFLFFGLWGISLFAEGTKGFTGLGEKIDISPDDKTVVFSHYEMEMPLCTLSLPLEEMLNFWWNLKKGNLILTPFFHQTGKRLLLLKSGKRTNSHLVS